MNVELKEKRELMNDLDEKLTMCNRTNDSLVERIRQFEEQVEAFVSNNKLADVSKMEISFENDRASTIRFTTFLSQEQIIDLNKTVADYECKFKDQEQRLKQIDQQLETEKNKNEDLTLQLATSVSEIKSLNEIMRAKEKELNEQVENTRSNRV